MAGGPQVLTLLGTVFDSVFEVFLLCITGYILATKGIIDKPGTKLLNKLNVNLFTPALLCSKVAFSLSPQKLRELHVIPIGFVVVTVVSVAVAWGLGHLFRLSRSQRSFCIAASAFMNSNSLPIALMQSLVVTVPHLKWTKDDNKDAMLGRALTYLVMYSTLGMVLRWSWGVKLLTQADDEAIPSPFAPSSAASSEDEDEDPSARQDTSSLLRPKPPITLSHASPSPSPEPLNDPPHMVTPASTVRGPHRPAENGRFYRSWPNTPGGPTPAHSIYSDGTAEDERAAGAQPFPPWVRRTARALGKTGRKFNSFMTAPLWAALVSIIIALIPPLQAWLAKIKPLRGALKSAGNVSVPLTLVVLGAYFYTPPPPQLPLTAEEQEQAHELHRTQSIASSIHSYFKRRAARKSPAKPGETRTIVVAVLARMIVTPSLLLPFFLWDNLTESHRIMDDPVFVVSACLLIGSPTALTLAQITQAASGDAFERLISKTIFVSYALLTPITSLAYVVLGLVLSQQ